MMADTIMTDNQSTDQNNNNDKTNVTDNSDEKIDGNESELEETTTQNCMRKILIDKYWWILFLANDKFQDTPNNVKRRKKFALIFYQWILYL